MPAEHDGKPPAGLPCPVATFHRDTYENIDPRRPELSMQGRKAIVTGGGSGIGRATVIAFAAAGARIVILGGRREQLLQETKAMVAKQFPDIEVQVLPIDNTNPKAVETAVENVGGWDVAVLNGAYLPNAASIAQLDIEDWWRSFEVNVKGNAILMKALLPHRNTGAALLAVNSCIINLGPAYTVKNSGYVVTKLALARLMENLSEEVSDLQVVSYHPGGVRTDMYDKFFGEAKSSEVTDALELPAHFAVWLASPEAKFLRGKFVWANWDVIQLRELQDRIETTPFLTQNTLGWPFGASNQEAYVDSSGQ